MNEDNIDDTQWDDLVAKCLALFTGNPKLIELCQTIFSQIGMDWPGETPSLLEQAAENLISLAALRLIEPSAVVERALLAMDIRRVRGKPALVKIMQAADTFQQAKVPPKDTEHLSSVGTKTCSYCNSRKVPQSALFCQACGCAAEENASTCQRCHYTPNEQGNCCSKCGLITAEQPASTNVKACPIVSTKWRLTPSFAPIVGATWHWPPATNVPRICHLQLITVIIVAPRLTRMVLL